MTRTAASVRARAMRPSFDASSVGLICVFVIATIGVPRAAAEERPSKSRYDLFHPTPDALLREFATDRPDKTESAYTVDAGHYQIEMDLIAYTYDTSVTDGAHEEVRALAIAPINFKVGLLNNVDLQVIAETYNLQQTKDRDARRRSCVSGFGDLLVRCKANLWGNDGGASAFSVMPFLKFPTSQQHLGNGALEGGIIFPFALQLPGEWNLGAQAEVNYLKNSASSDYHEEMINTVTVGHDIMGKLAGYVELFSNLSNERDAKWIATFDFGFTYEVTRDIQLDAGMNIGLSSSADDLNPFLGLSLRY